MLISDIVIDDSKVVLELIISLAFFSLSIPFVILLYLDLLNTFKIYSTKQVLASPLDLLLEWENAFLTMPFVTLPLSFQKFS